MKYLSFKNGGEIDPAAFTLLGASTKRNDNTKIGLFGSGNKYALAFFLRNQFDVKIFSGTKPINVSVEYEKFREQEFGVIHINGEKTSITTETGPKWTLWQSVREFFSNAMDEGNEDMELSDEPPQPKDGMTTIIVSADNPLTIDMLDNFWRHRERYFGFDRDFLYMDKSGRKIYTGRHNTIYRKGIRVTSEGGRKQIFDYDLPNIDINESRLISYTWISQEQIARVLLSCDIESVCKKVLENIGDMDMFEHNDAISSWGGFIDGLVLSDTYKKLMKGKYVAPTLVTGLIPEDLKDKTYPMPKSWCDFFIREIGKEIDALDGSIARGHYYQQKKMDAFQKAMLDETMKFFEECGYSIDYDVIMGDFGKDNSDLLGLADFNKQLIVLTERVFRKGKHELACTIIEEQVHLKTKASDESRNMQNALIDEMVTYMKNNNSITL